MLEVQANSYLCLLTQFIRFDLLQVNNDAKIFKISQRLENPHQTDESNNNNRRRYINSSLQDDDCISSEPGLVKMVKIDDDIGYGRAVLVSWKVRPNS